MILGTHMHEFGATTTRGETAPYDWGSLFSLLVHPMRVEIIEALYWIREPLSATDLRKLLDGRFTSQHISYHLAELVKVGVVKEVGQRAVRGATEKFYFFS
jgi:predicted HTH transcriptional regulator